MLLLYTVLFGYKLTPSEPKIVSNQTKFNKFNADSEQTSSAKVESTKLAEEIRNIKQTYHLERRLFR
jgi:hypothetical protein